MKLLSKLTIKNLKLNKVRTIVTIVGITLSCALITGLACLITSFLQTSINQAIANEGNRHVTFFNVKEDEIKYLINHSETESYYLKQGLGYAYLEGGTNDYKPYLYIEANDLEALKYGNELIEGRLPLNSNEIVIPEHIMYDGLVEFKVGEKITLEIGSRMSDGYQLLQSNPFTDDEELIINQTKEYEIVGIMKRPNYENYSAPGYTVITKLDDITSNVDVSLLYKNSKDYSSITASINGTETDLEKGKYEFDYNTSLLQYEGSALESGTMKSIYAFGLVVAIIIMISSIFCIRNSFAISITEKTKQYGMLASLGATPKQIKKNVLYEGFILGLIGITLGILFGILATYILVLLINMLLYDQISMEMVFNISYEAILISVFLASITIYLSCNKSAKRASKITEIEAIRSSNDIKNKKIKSPKLIKNNLGIGALISYKNMKRNKKKFRVTIVSLTVSILTFISLSSFLDIGFGTLEEQYQQFGYNVEIQNYDNLKNLDINELMKNVDNYAVHSYLQVEVSPVILNKEDEAPYFDLYSLGKDAYLKYIDSLGYEYDEVYNKALVINTKIYDYEANKFSDIDYFNDIPSIEIVGGNTIDIIEVTEYPLGFIESFRIRPIIILSDSYLEEVASLVDKEIMLSAIYIDSEDPSQITKDLNLYLKNNKINLSIFNIEEQMKMIDNTLLLVSIFLYGFITVITLIGLTSVFNTITTNMNLRRNEFAMMQSIGMTKKEFNKMILFESCLYGFKSLLYGIPLGIIGSYLMYLGTNVSDGTSALATEFKFPTHAILLSIIFVFIIIFVIMKFSMNKINKYNVVETIRNENI